MDEEKADSRSFASPNGLLTVPLGRVSYQRRVSRIHLEFGGVF